MIEEIVSVGALLSTLASFLTVVLNRRLRKESAEEQAVESLQTSVDKFHQMSLEATQDKHLSLEEAKKLKAALDALQSELQHVRDAEQVSGLSRPFTKGN